MVRARSRRETQRFPQRWAESGQARIFRTRSCTEYTRRYEEFLTRGLGQVQDLVVAA